MRYADLHVHTHYSDSTLSPEDVVKTAKKAKLSAIAVCDHDCTDGIGPARDAAGLELEIIPGVELTVEKDGIEVHILGYFLGYGVEWFQKMLKEIREGRVRRIYKMIEKLGGAGMAVKAEDVFRIAGKGSIGRLHLAQAMFNAGKVKRIQEAFDNYIGNSRPCYVPNIHFAPKDAIEAILRLGGVPVYAHPAVMGKDEFIAEFAGYGLRGIEAYHSDHSPSVSRHYEEIAKRNALIVTGGSDCHGLGKGRILMGTVKVPYGVVETLKEEAGRVRGSSYERT